MRKLRVLAAVLAVAAVALVAGCQQPLPLARLVSGGQFTSTPAINFCYDLGTAKAACRSTTALPGRLTVKAGAQVGIEVPPDLAGQAWVVRVVAATGAGKTQAQTTPPLLGGTYVSLTPAFGSNQALLLDVIGYSAINGQALPVSRWSFLLIRA